MNELKSNGKLTLRGNTIKKILIGIVIIAFFAFADFSIYVYSVKVIAIVGLLFLSRYIKNDSYLRWIIIFSIWAFSSIIWAIDKNIVISYFIWYLQAVLLAYSVGICIDNSTDIEYILICIMIGGVILAMRSLQGIQFSAFGTMRLGANIGYNENELALKSSLSCIIAFRYCLESDKRIRRVLYISFATISLIAVLFTGSRKGIIMVFGAFFLYGILNSSNPLKLIRNIIIASMGLWLVYYLMSEVEIFYNAFGRRFLLLLNIFDEGAYVGNSIGNRLTAVELGIDAFKNSPITGYGLGNYIAATGLNGYAHNNYIQLLVDLGIVGVCIYYSMYIGNLYGLVSTIKKNRSLTSILLSMMLVIIVIEFGLVSFNSDYVQLIIVMSFCMIRINRTQILYDNTNVHH